MTNGLINGMSKCLSNHMNYKCLLVQGIAENLDQLYEWDQFW